MSSHLLAAAFACDKANARGREAVLPDVTVEKMEQTEKAISHTSSPTEKAISHKSSPDSMDDGRKKRPPGGAVGGNAAKKNKLEPMFTPAAGADGEIHCIFVDGVCIPLWPQYVDRSAIGNFIKVGTQEEWVIQFMVALRKSASMNVGKQDKEKDASGKDKTNWTRHFVKSVFDELLHEFKRAVGVARADEAGAHKHVARVCWGQGLLGINMHGCDVVASSNARYFCIQATKKSVLWIQSGLRQSVKTYIDGELRAMSHTSSTSAYDQVPSMINMRAGVRDKIMWMPEGATWSLKYKGDKGEVQRYCNMNEISISVPTHLCDVEFLRARDTAFQNAMVVWNAVDKSGRKRIVGWERPLNVQMVPVPYTLAMSHTASDQEEGGSHAESETSDNDEQVDA